MDDTMKYALKLLKKKDYYIKDLYDKLVDKGFRQLDICIVIKDLVKMDFINDEKLVYLKMRNFIFEKKYGKNYIINYFSKKNISMNLVLFTLNLFGTDIFNINKQLIINNLKSSGKDDKYISYYLVKKGYDFEE